MLQREYILRLGQYAALSIFVLIFPAFFVYHSAAGLGFTPLFMGGWASAVNLAGTIVLVPFAAYLVWPRNWKLHAPFALLVAIVFFVALYYRFFGDHWQARPIAFNESLKLIIGWLSLYSVGCLLAFDRLTRNAVYVAFIIMSAIAIIWADWDTLSYVLELKPGAPWGITEYSNLATSYIIVAIIAISRTTDIKSQMAMIAAATLVTFLLSSRSEVAAFSGFVVAWAAYTVSRKRYIPALLGLAVSAAITSGLFAAPTIIRDHLPQVKKAMEERLAARKEVYEQQVAAVTAQNKESGRPPPAKFQQIEIGNFRHTEIFEITKSESASVRWETVRVGWNHITNSPILGDYAGQIRDLRSFGMYAHNILSVWQQYGLVAFLLFVGMTLGAVTASIFNAFTIGGRRWIVAAYISGVAAVLVIGTKAVYWPIPALGWGLAISSIRRDPDAPN